jgi:hypothetical protein
MMKMKDCFINYEKKLNINNRLKEMGFEIF